MSETQQDSTSNDPYHVLGVASTANADEIRERYLELVRQYPPDRDPKRFAEIRHAFDQLADPVESLRSQLFRTGTVDSIAAVVNDLQSNLRRKRIPTATLLGLGKTN